MDYASLLNDKQLAAVTTKSQFVRVIAGAGSGKTRVLTYRISYLISDCGVDPSRILAIAFTNKVADEMADRDSRLVYDLLGRMPYLHISTFHSFCARFLRAECAHVDYPPSFTIYDEDDQQKLVKSIAPSLGFKKGDDAVKQALSYIRRQKGKGLYPEDINPTNSLYEQDKISYKFYQQYELKKTLGMAFDFDDLLLQTIKILEESPDVRTKWSHRFDHILIDEFQDTNDIQYKLLSLLCRPDTSVYVVGDPDQTIYTWRGANQKIIMEFDKHFPGAETVILNENYRSTKTILSAANKLIAHNRKRVPKDLFTNGPEGDSIEVHQSYSADEEAEWVVRRIGELGRKNKDENGDPVYRNIAILYRSSYMTRPFEAALKDEGIPYRIFGGLRFYERKEVKDLLAYFNLFLNPNDNVAFERIVNVPRRGIGDGSLDLIRDEAASHSLSEYEYVRKLSEFSGETELKPRVINSLRNLVSLMEETREKLKNNYEAYSGILKDFATDIGYFSYLTEDEDPDEDRVGNVNALFDDINHFIQKNPEATFAEYLQNVSLLTGQDDMNDGNYVSLMTIHVAKGLEFDYVFIICLNEGAFPSVRAEMESGRDGEEEERRLAYVAMTRAKKRLYMSCNTSYSYATDSHSIASKYFAEAGLTPPKREYKQGSFGRSRDWRPSFGRGSSSFDDEPSYKRKSGDFFGDGDSISPFEETPRAPEPKKASSNGITDWQVGDKVHHEKFGDGVVTNIVSDSIIIVKFDVGAKTLLSTHPMLSRIARKGGQA